VPLILCALGLAVCFRASIWNIGAEGQFTVGALCSGAMLVWLDVPGHGISGGMGLVLMIVAGIIGGACGRPSPLTCATSSMPMKSWSR
jgi:simple sugar transport system permease protein